MFSKATANFVHQIDPEGSLIPVSRVNDSKKLVPMALVVKRNRPWIWQKPKYHPTDFSLSNLLQGDEALHPEVSETDFLTYNGTFGDKLSGQLGTEAGSVSVILEGRGSSKLQSSFGKLKKQELEVTKLLKDSKDRKVDRQHVLVQQLKKRDDVLAVVKERILTTSSCSVTMIKKDQCNIRGVLRLMGMLENSVKVSVKDSTNIEADSDVSLEIPPGTVIAYSIRELTIKKNGQYDIGVQPDTTGGIESDSLEMPAWDSLNTVDGRCCPEEMLSSGTLLNESQERELHALAELPRSTRCALFQHLRDIMIDRSALACLQSVLEDLCCSQSPDMTENDEASEGDGNVVSDLLDQLSLEYPVEESASCSPTQMNAAHLLVSALEELPDQTLNLLSRATPEFLEAFDKLISNLKEANESLAVESLPVVLNLAEELFSTASLSLRRDNDRVWVEAGRKAELLLLHLSVHGLVLLAKC